jgi:hypothetical protein
MESHQVKKFFFKTLLALALLTLTINVSFAQNTNAGFTPAGVTQSMSVTNVSSNITLNTTPGSAVLVTNTGPNTAYIKGASTATVSDFPIPPGVAILMNYPPGQIISAITSSGTATLTVSKGNGTTALTGNGSGGSATPGAGAQPYNYTPLTPDQHNLSIATSTPLTIPSGALQAVICAAGANVNYTYDGTTTPTATVGLPLLQNQCVQLSGSVVLSNFRAIQQAATATLNVGYTR